MIFNKNEPKASISLKRILIICLIVISLSGICVMATNIKINYVKITLANNCEINTITTKTKVSEILKEKNIILLPDEKVLPGLEQEVKEDENIIISKLSEQEQVVELAKNNSEITVSQILNAYSPIVEKIVVEQVSVPFETITKDVANNSNETTNRVIQEGKEGLKEVTYKIKYQNDKEIEKTEVSSVLIKEPVNKIIQVKSKVTNRSSSVERTANTNTTSNSNLASRVDGKSPIVKTMNTSAYTASTCGKSENSSGYGRTASGATANSWYTIAAGKSYPIGTIVYIPYFKNKPNGGWFVVQDRGGAISNNRIDIYMGTYNECVSFGRKNLECYIY